MQFILQYEENIKYCEHIGKAYFLHVERMSNSPQVSSESLQMSLPGSPERRLGPWALPRWGKASLGAGWRRGAELLGSYLGAVETVELPKRAVSLGADGQEVQSLPPALRVAFAVALLADRRLGLELLLQEADRHLQDVGLLQLGVRVPPAELCLQQALELLDAAVDAVSAHLLHHWLSQLLVEKREEEAG